MESQLKHSSVAQIQLGTCLQLALSQQHPVTCKWPTHPPESRGPRAKLIYTNSSSGKGMKECDH